MTIKRRRTTATTGTDGATTTWSKSLTLGAAYGIIRKIELKALLTGHDSSADYLVLDAEGRRIWGKTSLNIATDDSALKATNQVYSTFGKAVFPVGLETDVIDKGGDAMADAEGGAPQLIAASPLTISQENGTDADVCQITVYVEV